MRFEPPCAGGIGQGDLECEEAFSLQEGYGVLPFYPSGQYSGANFRNSRLRYLFGSALVMPEEWLVAGCRQDICKQYWMGESNSEHGLSRNSVNPNFHSSYSPRFGPPLVFYYASVMRQGPGILLGRKFV